MKNLNRVVVALGVTLLLGPNLVACNLISSSDTCQTITAGGRGGGSKSKSGSSIKTKPKSGGTKPIVPHHDSEDCDDD